MKKKTTIYLSIDGTILRPKDATKDSEWSDDITFTITGGDEEQTFIYSPDVIELINDIADRDDIDIRWLTNWRDEAVNLISPLLDINGTDWNVVEDGTFTGSKKFSKSNADYWWKIDAFKQDIFNHPYRRLIWIDNAVEDNANDIDNWLDPCGIDEDNRLYIAPNANIGLTPAHFESIFNFLDK